ncbi:MAG: hypothetical protein J0I41_11035 [Filimonas sp.]|nr:hypothetical protein [Filimonas sp.]
MLLYKEVLRHAGSTTIKETFFNSEKKIIAILELYQDVSPDRTGGVLSVYDYTGESYRLLRYSQDTNSYKRFRKEGPVLLLTPGWHTTSEANYSQECKYDKGLLMEKRIHNIAYNEKESTVYFYEKGAKTIEQKVMTDGSRVTINYVNDSNGVPLSKATLKDGVFTDQVNYNYQPGGLLSVEQIFKPHNGQKFAATEKRYFYNAKKQVEKTEYYGRYNGQLYLYKVEEEIRKGDTVSKKSSGMPELEMAVGYYDLAALHSYFKENNMEAYIPYYDKDFAAKSRLMQFNYAIDKLDQQGNPVETSIMNPEKPEEQLTKVAYRNEYNEDSLLEFVITYILNDKQELEENSIKKLYYK